MLSHVTFTGWDDRTDYVDLASFCRDQRPGTVEIAVLLSHGRMGEDRYPSVENAEAILRVAKAHDQRTAVHVCGSLARRTLEHGYAVAGASSVVSLADRVQVNVPVDFWPVHAEPHIAAIALAERLERPVIVQVRGSVWPHQLGRVLYLFDRSGGRGEVTEQVPPLTNFPVGYAGGLGPSNVHAFLDRLRPMSRVRPFAPIWIDMESGIREDTEAVDDIDTPPSRASVSKCRQVMDAVRWALPG